MPNDVGDGVHYRETQDESRRERAVDVDGVDTPGESRRARPDPGGQERGKLLNLRLCATDELRRRVHFQNLDDSQPQGGLPVRYCSYTFLTTGYRVDYINLQDRANSNGIFHQFMELVHLL